MPHTVEHAHGKPQPVAGTARRHRQHRRVATPLAADAATRLAWVGGAILALWLAVWWALS